MFIYYIIKPFSIFFIGFCLSTLFNHTVYSSEIHTIAQNTNISNNQENLDQNLLYLAYYSRTRSHADSEKRRGNWDYKANWRHDREAFFRGETQHQAYQAKNPYGPGGVGYDGDPEYVRNNGSKMSPYQRAYDPNEISSNYRGEGSRYSNYPTQKNAYRSYGNTGAQGQYSDRQISDNRNVYYPPARNYGRYDRNRVQ